MKGVNHEKSFARRLLPQKDLKIIFIFDFVLLR